jgi:hypothetical protein
MVWHTGNQTQGNSRLGVELGICALFADRLIQVSISVGEIASVKTTMGAEYSSKAAIVHVASRKTPRF